VLIHGVGFGPETFDAVVAALQQRVSLLVVSRRGYGRRGGVAPAPTVEDHVEDLCGALDDAGVQRAVLVGVSGGATVALAAALRRPERVAVAVAHEPAVGSLVPELRSLIVGALEQGGGGALARFLAGERTWGRLPEAIVSRVAASESLIEADALAFARYEPEFPSADVRVPLVCSLGEHSGRARVQVAASLSARTGAPVMVVPGCGHLPQLDAPEQFAELIVNRAVNQQGGS
jgi:pimeloyl-ACP methyl ester carboxylesterase